MERLSGTIHQDAPGTNTMRTNCRGTKTVRSPLNNAEALVEAANRIVLALSPSDMPENPLPKDI